MSCFALLPIVDVDTVRVETFVELRRRTGSVSDTEARARATRGEAHRLLCAIDNCWYEGWNNGFCNVIERFGDPGLEPNAHGDAAEALAYLSGAGVASAATLLRSLRWIDDDDDDRRARDADEAGGDRKRAWNAPGAGAGKRRRR
jgi:hypothetical protein